MDSRICPNRAAHLAHLERKGDTLKLGLHLPTLKEVEISTLLGRRAVGLGRCQFRELGLAGFDLGFEFPQSVQSLRLTS